MSACLRWETFIKENPVRWEELVSTLYFTESVLDKKEGELAAAVGKVRELEGGKEAQAQAVRQLEEDLNRAHECIATLRAARWQSEEGGGGLRAKLGAAADRDADEVAEAEERDGSRRGGGNRRRICDRSGGCGGCFPL